MGVPAGVLGPLPFPLVDAGQAVDAALFQHVIDIDRVTLLDFGTGNDAYKAEWMEEVRERFRLEIFWPNHPANWPHIAIRKWRAYRARKQVREN